MKFIIAEEIFKKFPHLNAGVVVSKGIDNRGTNQDVLDMIRVAEGEMRAKFGAQPVSTHPKIEVWRKTYSSFGVNPKEHLSSVENLYRLVLKGVSIRHINNLVDIYNLISLKHMVPLGGEDLDKIKGDIKLTTAGPNEPSVLLLGDKEARPPHENEIIYKDDISAICRRLNWREADRTKFTEETTNAVLVAEGLAPVKSDEIQKIVNELVGYVNNFCGGESVFYILNSKNSQVEFEVN